MVDVDDEIGTSGSVRPCQMIINNPVSTNNPGDIQGICYLSLTHPEKERYNVDYSLDVSGINQKLT